MQGDERKRTAEDVSKSAEVASEPGVFRWPGISLEENLLTVQMASGMKAA